MKKIRTIIATALLSVTLVLFTACHKQNKAADNEEQQSEVLTKGAVAPDFTLEDINGGRLSLSDLRGKYVVVDFWGSWCRWCIYGMPEMKKYYEKYSDRLEVLGVNCRDTQEAWRTAVKEYELPWRHVYLPDEDMTLLEDYKIQGYPTKVILDAKGRVIETVIGEEPEFYTMLDSIMAE